MDVGQGTGCSASVPRKQTNPEIMNKIENVAIGGRSFIIDEDAYQRLNVYLEHFRSRLDPLQKTEVMDELEGRIAELFSNSVKVPGQVVGLHLVEDVISQLGMPDGRAESSDLGKETGQAPVEKKFFRDPDRKSIGGVCSGLAAYFNVDLLLVRLLMLVLLVLGGAGFWIYIILWLVAPQAVTAAEKCEMRGWPVTAENMAKFSSK